MRKTIHTGLCLLALISLFLLWASCITPRKGPIRKLKTAQESNIAPFDAIIIPGIPYEGRGWDSVMKARVLWSWILYKNGIAKNIIYSGAAVYTPYVEARIMGLYGEKLGIPAEHIFFDTLARHSTENVYYSYLLAGQLGFKSIALATDPFQSFMLRSFTRRRFGTQVYHLPFITDSLARYNHLAPKIKTTGMRQPEWKAIGEEEGFFKRMRGTMGRQIDWKQHEDGKLAPL